MKHLIQTHYSIIILYNTVVHYLQYSESTQCMPLLMHGIK